MAAAKHTPSKAQHRALRNASERPRGNICPVFGVHAAAEDMLLQALYRRGWADPNGCVPVITDAGRAAIAKATGSAS
jgi:hypothetical protein